MRQVQAMKSFLGSEFKEAIGVRCFFYAQLPDVPPVGRYFFALPCLAPEGLTLHAFTNNSQLNLYKSLDKVAAV